MCVYSVSVIGTTPVLQQWLPEFKMLGREGMFVTDSGQVYEPAEHFEWALIKAMGEGFKEDFYISPRRLLYGIEKPAVLLKKDGEQPIYFARAKMPAINIGWKLNFNLAMNCQRITEEMLKDTLFRVGKEIGIGQRCPEYGQFEMTHFARIMVAIMNKPGKTLRTG